MIEFLTNLSSVFAGDQTLIRIAITLGIVLAGHICVKAVGFGLRKLWSEEEMSKKEVSERNNKLRNIKYGLDAVVIASALVYLNTGITDGIYTQTVEMLPEFVSVVLIAALGVILINIVTRFTGDFLKTVGAKNYFRDLGLSSQSFNLVKIILKGFLYLLLIQVIMGQVGIDSTVINTFVYASAWGVVILVAGLLLFGFKDLFQNYAAGIYLKNSRRIRPGEQVDVNGSVGEIRKISLLSTLVDTNDGYTVMTPNSELMNSSIRFKRAKSDLDTLEEIKEYFKTESDKTQEACIEMAMEIFGYFHPQQEVEEKLEEVEAEEENEKAMEAIEELTNKEIRTAFVEHDKITDVADDFKTWFNDGALVICRINRDPIFAESGEQYVLAAGVEENEILIIDPNSDNGGVYYVSKDTMKEAMDGENLGYTVLAPEGTTSFWRVKNELIYGDKSYYDELSKTLEARLRKITRQGRILSDVMPQQLKNYTDKWKMEGNVTQVWEPENQDGGESNETSESN
jgi:hypothetical protein